MDIGQTLQDGLTEVVAFLPNLIGFLLLLLVGYIVAKVVSAVVSKALQKTGVDDKIKESSSNKYVDAALPGATVSKGVGTVVFWLIFVFFLFSAVGALKVPALTGFMNSVLAYLPNVIAAIAIFVVAALVSGAVATAVTKLMGDTPTGKIVATVGPALVMVIAMFMILEQLQIAPEIVRIAFGAVMFALALGLALAFGLGGRDVAARLLEDAYTKGREQKDRVRADVQTAKDNAPTSARDRSDQETVQYTPTSSTSYPTTGGATGGSSTY